MDFSNATGKLVRLLEHGRLDIGRAGEGKAATRKRRGAAASRSTLYILLVLGSALGTYMYKLRTEGIFACSAGYAADRYLAYCHAAAYGDYEHGAFWFDFEPTARSFARSAEVLFLGDSHMQYAFSTMETADWFATARIRYYLLGFGYSENSAFTSPLLNMLHPRAELYVINADGFFDQRETIPAQTVMHENGAKGRYEAKHLWQLIHERICEGAPVLCGDRYVIFRSRETGAYHAAGLGQFTSKPVSYDGAVDRNLLLRRAVTGVKFLSHLAVGHECIILTLVPTVGTKLGNAQALAEALGTPLIAPRLDHLQTFDGSHLDRASAERWSAAFFRAASPQIRRCFAASRRARQ